MKKHTRKKLARNIPISIDPKLLADVDTVAGDRNETRSLIMRKAIEEGLPIVKAGGNADVLTLDSELSSDVDKARKETGLPRNKILIEAIRAGFHAYVSRTMSEKLSLADVQDPKEKESLLRTLEGSYKLYTEPMAIEHRRLIFERGDAVTLLKDILFHVPEAKRRHDLLMQLKEYREKPGGGGGGSPWGRGLTTEEIEWQVSMTDKYGVSAAVWPKGEVDAHNAAIAEKKSNQP